MRKYGLYLLIAISLMTGCQKKDAETSQTAAETTVQESTAAETQEENKTESAPEDHVNADSKEDRLAPIPIAVPGDYDGEWDDDQNPIITSRCDRVCIQGDGYEALKKALAEKNDEMAAEHKKEYEEYRQEALDMRKEMPDQKLTYACNYEFHPIRFDGAVASMSWMKYYDLGGAHPSTYNAYYNFDTQTGKQLALSDVVKDMDGFTAYVKNELAGRAAQGELFDGYEESVDNMFAGDDPDLTLEWAVTEKGVSVYFEEYVIAPYAAGEIEVAVPFKGHEEMFDESYAGSQSDGWAKKITPWETVTYQTDNGDTSVNFTYEGSGNEGDDYTQEFTIEREQNGKTDNLKEEVYGKIGDAWLLMTDDGRAYLYMELSSENDWKTLEVFDLNGSEMKDAGSSNDSTSGSPIQTPDAFYLTRRIDALGTYSAYRKFHIGEDGMPVPEEEVYTKVRISDSKDDETALVSVRDLPATLFNADGSQAETVLPAGTQYYVRSTDLETFVDMELSDGRKCRLQVKKSDKGWGFEIDGVDEEECFEFIPYAG